MSAENQLRPGCCLFPLHLIKIMKVSESRTDVIWYFNTRQHSQTLENCPLHSWVLNVNVLWWLLEQLASILNYPKWYRSWQHFCSFRGQKAKKKKSIFSVIKGSLSYLRPVCWEFLERWAWTSFWNREGRVILLSDLDTREQNIEED